MRPILLKRKIWIDSLLISFLALILLEFRLVDYGLMQLCGQLRIVFGAVPIEEVLSDPTVSPSVKQKMRFISEVEQFGIDKLGLKPTSNYKSYYDQQGKPLLWVVTAAEEFSLKPYMWHFPLLGDVSYKGFFQKPRADRLAIALKQDHWDVYAYEVGAWSTLGWFRDPVLSGMLERDYGQLAELILHELTHATVYMKSDVDYNENLASFVGEQGALQFLRKKFSDTSRVYTAYRERLVDDDHLTRFMVNGARLLDSLYQNREFISAGDQRKRLKADLIAQLVYAFDTLHWADPSRFQHMSRKTWNNARFLSYLRYDAQKDSMKAEMMRLDSGELKLFVRRVRQQFSDS